jgi:hypothetical protein
MLEFMLTTGRVLATLVGIWATITFVRHLAVISRRLRRLGKHFFAWPRRRHRRRKSQCHAPSFRTVFPRRKKKPAQFPLEFRRKLFRHDK